MSNKYRQYLAIAKRDEELCAACGHPRGQHVSDKHCSFRQVGQCTCAQFVSKKGGAK